MKVRDLFEAKEKSLVGMVIDGTEVTVNGKPRATWSGYFSCSLNNLTSLEGAPSKVNGNFSCHNNKLTSLEGAPSKVNGSFFCTGNNIKSISGIHKIIKEIHEEFWCDDVTHVLGLCLIKGITRVYHDNKKVQSILNKHVGPGTRDAMVDCHEELVEAGLEEYAQL